MRWKNARRSQNIQHRSSLKGGSIGIAGLAILLIGWFFGIDPQTLLQVVESGNLSSQNTNQRQTPNAQYRELADFTSVILASSEDIWQPIFAQHNLQYRPTTLITYDHRVQSACGINTSATGPFYCPSDENIYLDLSFIHQMQRMGAQGDFAFAYVIAHEVGHHVQKLLGTLGQAHKAMQSLPKTQANQISVRIELQADCYAGIWAHNIASNRIANLSLDANDLVEGMNAAQAIGDDRLLEAAGARIHPENFTHGSAKQRQHWLSQGIQHGSLSHCNTFKHPL